MGTRALGVLPKQILDSSITDLSLLARVSSDVVVSNTTTETSLFSYTVPGGTLGTNKAIAILIFGTIKNNSGASRNMQLRLKWGGSTVISLLTSTWLGASATTFPFFGHYAIVAANATGTQECTGYLFCVPTHQGRASASVDSTSNQTLELTCQMDTADVNLILTLNGAVIILGDYDWLV